jgi:hypothetical protein
MARTCIWTGDSGAKYEYKIFDIDGDWNDVPGNYIFAKETSPRKWGAVYIGETESFKERIPNHNELPCIRRNGGTHVHAHVNRDSRARLSEEADLCAYHSTPCND